MRAIDADNVLLRITSEKEDNWKSCKGKPNEYDIGVNNGLALAHAIVLGTPPIEVPRWIPVTERLPDLVPCAGGGTYSEAVNVLTTGRKVMTAVWDGIDFICPMDYWCAWGEEITHWTPVLLPLPDAPKDGE